jgi:acyl carrier protein
MSIEKFIADLEANIVGAEPGTLNPDTAFRDLPYWDSLAALTAMATFDACFGRQISGQQIASCRTIRDIFDLGAKS